MSSDLVPTKPVCGAKLRKSDPPRFCQRPPIVGRERCRLHGGATSRGADLPQYKGRGYSRDLPTRYADRLRAAEDDPELLTLSHEMRLLDARMGEVLAKIPEGESGTAWSLATNALKCLTASRREGNEDKVDYWLEQLDKALGMGNAERDAWSELYSTLELRRKLADTERKRVELHESTLTAKEAQVFFGALQVAILEEVPDPTQRLRLAKRLELLLHQSQARSEHR